MLRTNKLRAHAYEEIGFLVQKLQLRGYSHSRIMMLVDAAVIHATSNSLVNQQRMYRTRKHFLKVKHSSTLNTSVVRSAISRFKSVLDEVHPDAHIGLSYSLQSNLFCRAFRQNWPRNWPR